MKFVAATLTRTKAINLTLAEFEDKYYLHDSSIDKIDFDADKKILTLTTSRTFRALNMTT